MKRKKQGKETSSQMTTKRNAEDRGTFGELEKEKKHLEIIREMINTKIGDIEEEID